MSAKSLLNTELVEVVEDLTAMAVEQEKVIDLMTDALIVATGEIMKRDLALSIATEVIIPALAAEVQAYEEKERDAAKLAATILALREKPEMANLPIDRREVRLVVDKVAIGIAVRPETREMNAKTTFDFWGDPEKVIVTSSAKAYAYVDLPFLGKIKVDANMTYTDTSEAGESRHVIENVIEFTVNIAGRDRLVKVVASGMVNEAGYGWEYGVDVTVNGQLCKRCGGNHGDPLHFEGLIS